MTTRSSSVCALAALLLASHLPAQTTTSNAADEQAIRKMVAQYDSAFNRRDVAGLTAALAEDYVGLDIATPHGVEGRAQRESGWKESMSRLPAAIELYTTVSVIKWLDATHALAHGTWESRHNPGDKTTKGTWLA